jgi:epoxide hydrolase-like predicted phosphatase
VAPESSAPRGLLIDWGGVLTHNLFASFDAHCVGLGLEPGTVSRMIRSDPRARALVFDLECGRMPEETFEIELADTLGVPPAGLIDALFEGARADEVMHDAVVTLRQAGVRTGLLSNSWGATRYDRTRWAEMFDVLVISGEHRVRKPEARIYEIAVARMDLPPSELVFVDDIGANLKPARAMGMTTILHVSAEQTVAELSRVFGRSLVS